MRAKKDESFRDYILDQLGGLSSVASRSMFGGHGLYQGPAFFGILSKGRLYFKTDRQTQALYQERGMKPFQPNAKQTLKNYYEVPIEVLEDSDQLSDWAQHAIRAGQSRP
jgi:DNA transformation protein